MADPRSVDAIADLELDSADGDPVRLGELFARGPVVLVFLRHFG